MNLFLFTLEDVEDFLSMMESLGDSPGGSSVHSPFSGFRNALYSTCVLTLHQRRDEPVDMLLCLLKPPLKSLGAVRDSSSLRPRSNSWKGGERIGLEDVISVGKDIVGRCFMRGMMSGKDDLAKVTESFYGH